MQRFGWMGKLRSECVEKYLSLHANVWPAVLRRNSDCHLRNYSIFHQRIPDGGDYLFSYVEYTGDDFDADMGRMAADPEVQRWWDECKPCFDQLADLPPGEVWVPMDEVFHQE